MAKTVNRLILNRIQPALDPLLRYNQNGFRPGRSTTTHILALRRLIEGVKANNLKAIITFIDFRKAFDSVHRGKMMKILRAYGIPNELVDAISLLYDDRKARVVSPDGETDSFNIVAGVLQGDTLAPYLFAIVLDYAMRQAYNGKEEELGFTLNKRTCRRIGPAVVTDADFADDIALLNEDIVQAQQVPNNVEMENKKIGLHLNALKTEAMSFNQPPDIKLKSLTIQEIKMVDEFKYLGGWMSSSAKDMKIRIAQAWTACHKLIKIWKSSLNMNIKVRLFTTTVESVLLYGSESWTLTSNQERKMDGVYTRMLRMVKNISWKQHITNEVLYGRLPKVSDKIRERRLKKAGHCWRHPEEVAHELILWEPTHGHTNRGRPVTNYVNTLKKDTGAESTAELKTLFEDRKSWKQLSNRFGREPGLSK